MTKRTLGLGVGALVLLAGAAIFGLRPEGVTQAATAPLVAVKDAGAVARLGDLSVSADELNAMLAGLPQNSREQLRGDRSAMETWIRARLAQKAVLEQASAQGWPERADIRQQTQAASDQIIFRNYLASVSQVPAEYPSAQELQKAYQANQSALQLPARYRLSQIFLAVNDPATLDAVRKQAAELSKRAQAPNADFGALARQYSQDTQSAAKGGDSGLQPLQQLLPEMRDPVSKLKLGTVSEPLQSTMGFHILKLTEQQPARIATLDEAREGLTNTLRQQRQEQIARAYVDSMISSATLSIDGSALKQVLDNPPAKP